MALVPQRAARLLPLESPARRCSGSKFSARRGLPSKGEARAPHHRPSPSLDLDHALPGTRCSTECSALFKARGGIRNYGTEMTKLANWETINGLNDQKREKP